SIFPGFPYIKGSIELDNAYKVYVSGNYAYVTGGVALRVIDISNPSNPELIGYLDLPGYTDEVYVSGSYAYVVGGGAILLVIDISDPSNPIIIGSVDPPGAAVVVQGAMFYVSGSYAYMAGGDSGLVVIDISNPFNPEIIGSVDTPGFAHAVSVSGSYAYVADRVSYLYSAFHIIDISNPSSPIITESSYYYGTNIISLHVSGRYLYMTEGEIYIEYPNITMGYLYSFDQFDEYEYHLSVYDISIPSSPKGISSIGISDYLNDSLYVSGNYAYVGTWVGLQIIDFSNIDEPIHIGYVEMPANGVDVYVSDNYAYVTDWDNLHIIDIRAPSLRSALIGSVDIPDYSFAIHVVGSYAYVSDGESGLYVINISSPSNPEIVGSVDTPGSARDVYVSGSYAYVADGLSGLQVIDISNPSSPIIIGFVELPDSLCVYVSGDYAYVADFGSGLVVIDISNPSSPIMVGSVDTPKQEPSYVYVSGSYAYISDGSGDWGGTADFVVIDISNPSNPIIVSSIETKDGGGVYVSGNFAYVAGVPGLIVINISTPSSPVIIGSVDTLGGGVDVYVSGGYAYVADGYSGLQVTMTPLLLEGNVEDPTTITATIPPDLPGSDYNIIVTNPNGEVGILRNGFRVVDAVDVTPPVISDVAVLDITDTTAIVTWDTDEPSDSVVEFGSTSGEYTDSISDTTLVTLHSQKLTDLTPDTTYYFIVKSADSSGNSIENQEHSFKTLTGIIV
ncbi:MAG: fibronectin type III domain-containing protein, partial [Nitrospinae bacterium]|nr:fibronectin type III domain-containing protein [Nitrospinota bacterium]